MPIDWSSLWKREDWWAVWLGLVVLALAITNIVTRLPKINAWTTDPFFVLTANGLIDLFVLGLGLAAITSVALLAMRQQVRQYLLGFPTIFILAFLAQVLSKQEVLNSLGIEYVLWALVFGLLISNIIGTPKWLEPATKSELFIKIGLVILGAEILFGTIMKAGALGIFEVTVGLMMVWYFAYFVSKKLGLTKSFSAVLATATSVCGVSAAIAAGGAIEGDKKEVSYVISLVLLFAAPMMVLFPAIGKLIGMPDAVAGAWIGGTIDNTASVAASGALYSDQALQIASIIKMSQNILIGVIAFLLALYWTLKVNATTGQQPKKIEIWYRFPKFVIGFFVASIVFSLILTPTLGSGAVSDISTITKGFRNWFFAMTFVSIGLNTNFKEMIKIGKGKPLIAFILATGWDIILSLITAYVFFGGIFFPPPI